MEFHIFAFLAVGAVALFTFLAVVVFMDYRTKERALYHRHETLKKLAEAPAEAAERVLEVIREEEKQKQRRLIEGLKLGGVITAGAGVALMGFLYLLRAEQPEGVFMVGLVPLLVGVGMLFYALVLAPKQG